MKGVSEIRIIKKINFNFTLNFSFSANRRLMPTFYVDSKNDLPREIMGFRIIQNIISLARSGDNICIILNPIISLGR